MVVVVDYGLGNLRSIHHKLGFLNCKAVISSDPEIILSASALIIPGVGSFASGMKKLESAGIREPLERAVLKNKTPILGICLGMQLFSSFSEEGNASGLGWISGTVKRFDSSSLGYRLRIPHVGWNNVEIVNQSPLSACIIEENRFYFTHSYYMECENASDVSAVTKYGISFPSIIVKENIMGTQFHPEKSHKYGMALIKAFLEFSQC